MYHIHLTPFAKLVAGVAILVSLLGTFATAQGDNTAKDVGSITVSGDAHHMPAKQRID